MTRGGRGGGAWGRKEEDGVTNTCLDDSFYSHEKESFPEGFLSFPACSICFPL